MSFLVAQLPDLTLEQGIELLAGFGLLFVIVWIARYAFNNWERRLTKSSPNAKTSLRYLGRLVIIAIILLGSASIIFAVFPGLGAAVSSLFIAAGFASIVIGMAAQSTLQNIFAGLALSSSQPFRINDAVLFKDEFCFVEDLKLTHTVLRTWDNRRLMVPNSVMQAEAFINYTISDPTKLVPVFFTISYESDVDLAMEIMIKAAKEHPDALPIGDLPNAVVMDLADYGVKLRLLTRAKDQPTAFMMTRDLIKTVKKDFVANGIKIPYPTTHLILDKGSMRELRETLAKGVGEKGA
jgi:small conductance mechanosensitive channel